MKSAGQYDRFWMPGSRYNCNTQSSEEVAGTETSSYWGLECFVCMKRFGQRCTLRKDGLSTRALSDRGRSALMHNATVSPSLGTFSIGHWLTMLVGILQICFCVVRNEDCLTVSGRHKIMYRIVGPLKENRWRLNATIDASSDCVIGRRYLQQILP